MYQQVEEYVKKFQEKYPSYQSEKLGFFSFGDTEKMADELSELVVKKIKTGTSSGYDLYKQENEPLPKVGQLDVVLNGKNEPVCIIKNINVTILPFSEVTKEHAWKEGEGDRTLAYWRKVHAEFFKHAYKEALNIEFTEEK
ncbi:TPA: ASCH domain-containing protein, partial [Enterococcus faecium]|nr:ASCH domain-containing protein [Enterococcus faecium]